MSITPEQMAAYKRTARAREARRQREIADRRRLARSLAEAAARLLKEEFGATKVVLYGSLAHGAWFHERSDIDLAVAGIQPQLFWRAWCALDRLGSQVEINLVDFEMATQRLLDEIARYGVEL